MATWVWFTVAGGALLFVTLIILLVVARKKPEPSRRVCGGCQRAMLPDWDKCLFCGWVPPPPLGQIEFILGPMTGQVVRLEGEVTTIGSVGGNNIVLADPAVSKKHVGIRRASGGYELADLGSTNGVYVNGQRTAKKILAAGDIIRVGTSEMVFRVG
jgi:hypothetical protein